MIPQASSKTGNCAFRSKIMIFVSCKTMKKITQLRGIEVLNCPLRALKF